MEPRNIIQTQTFESLSQKTDSLFLPVLIDIYHPAIVWGDSDNEQENGHLRVVNDTRWVKFKGNEKEVKSYAPCTFEYKEPKEDGKKKSNATLSVSCIDSRMIEIIRSVPEGLKCKVVGLYAKLTDSNGRVKYVFQTMNSAEYSMYSTTWDGVTASWTLDPDDTMEYSVPRDMATQFRVHSVIEES